MKALLAGNLVATAVEKDKKFYPAIDDGEAVYYFSAYIYGGKENAVSHAQKTINGLQDLLTRTTNMWYMNVKEK